MSTQEEFDAQLRAARKTLEYKSAYRACELAHEVDQQIRLTRDKAPGR
ncbi:hypothetical protein [Nocardia cyriacigeorgica]|nr:hypothetical protein [Nocardia cyriacigeorgica]MBF6453535.1 hypothetical protein [Nocardia cyriacigeorgica]MBF6478172.1 hypothetical protein [Nocardia cyriacigeorgica]MBF6550704.1 hypothetical protein [Nocardia cyriacigeorgica]